MAAFRSASCQLRVSGIDLLFGRIEMTGYSIVQKVIFRTIEYHTSCSDLKQLTSNFRIDGWRHEGGFSTCRLGVLNTENENL